MNFRQFVSLINRKADDVTAKGFDLEDVEVMITRSSGTDIICLMADGNIIEYSKVD